MSTDLKNKMPELPKEECSGNTNGYIDKETIARIILEASAAGSVNSENILSFLDDMQYYGVHSASFIFSQEFDKYYYSFSRKMLGNARCTWKENERSYIVGDFYVWFELEAFFKEVILPTATDIYNNEQKRHNSRIY